uniref:L1 transposable element RRM domain-containing protein n=1 Tax=Latimeria chalumnae TaxID=7897 RepID=H2ZUL3_LATCH
DMRNNFLEIKAGLRDIKIEMTTVNGKLDKLSHRMETAENRIGECEDRLYHMENLTAEIHILREKCDDLENRSCRSNLRIVGVTEGLEGRNPENFVVDHMTTVLGEEISPKQLEIERAHGTLRPRVMIVKRLRFQDKVAILRKARELGSLTFQNRKIFFFPDLSLDLQMKRREFTEARKLCYSLNLPFSLLYPAKLRVSLENGVKFFTDPRDAESFLRQVQENRRS